MKKTPKRPRRARSDRGVKAIEEVQREVREFEDRLVPPEGEPHPDPFTPPDDGQPRVP